MLQRPALQHDIKENSSTGQLLEPLPTYCLSHRLPIIVPWRAFANATYLWHVYLIKQHFKQKEARGTLARDLKSPISQDIPVKPFQEIQLYFICAPWQRGKEKKYRKAQLWSHSGPNSAGGTQSFCGGRLFFYGALMSLCGRKKRKTLPIYQLTIAGYRVEICTQLQ